MSYLVDTNVASEPTKPRPNARVVEWLAAHEPQLYFSTVTIGEIRRGIERLVPGQRQDALRRWLILICDRMRGRVISFNLGTAHVWGQLMAKWEAAGLTVPTTDGEIAATAHRYQLTVVTRNVADFQHTGVKIFNPFD